MCQNSTVDVQLLHPHAAAGAHEGAIERRQKCTVQGIGYAELDGQSTMIWFANKFWIFCRANRAAAGYRHLQMCDSDDGYVFSKFSQVHISTSPTDADIDLAHPYIPPNKHWLYLILPIVTADDAGGNALCGHAMHT